MNPITHNIDLLIHEVKLVTFSGLKGKGTPYKPRGAFKPKTKRARKTKASL